MVKMRHNIEYSPFKNWISFSCLLVLTPIMCHSQWHPSLCPLF